MKVFVTGATGFIGSAIVKDLLAAGHRVLGLTRSDAGAKSLAAAGAEAHRGHLDDLDGLRAGAAASDGVIHTAFLQDFSRFAAACEMDRRAIDALGSGLAGSDRPLVVSGVIGPAAPGRPATEADETPVNPALPRVSEAVAESVAARGVRVSVVRLPQVHDPAKQGLVSYLVAAAREKGVSAFVGDGSNRWPAVHRLDAARLYRLALERGTAERGSAVNRYHAVAEEGVRLRDIAGVIGRRLHVPVVAKTPAEAAGHFGWLGYFAGADLPASSVQTRQQLGWSPTGPGMLADLEALVGPTV